MTVSQLIEKLQTVRQDAIVVGDLPENANLQCLYLSNLLISPIIVSQGLVMLHHTENSTNVYVSADDWENYPQGIPGAQIPAIYIGTGVGIIGPEWQEV